VLTTRANCGDPVYTLEVQTTGMYLEVASPRCAQKSNKYNHIYHINLVQQIDQPVIQAGSVAARRLGLNQVPLGTAHRGGFGGGPGTFVETAEDRAARIRRDPYEVRSNGRE
jgi:hypothetical protein